MAPRISRRRLVLEAVFFSRASVARRAAKRRPIFIWETKRKPMSWFSRGYHGYQYCSWTRTQDDDDYGGVAQDGCHTPNTPNNRLTETCSLGLLCTSLILDIHVMINWHQSKQGIRWPYRGLKFTAHRGQVFFEVDRWPGAGFSIGSPAQVWLTCLKQGRIVRKPVNAHPGLNVNRIIAFSSMQMFCCFLCISWLLKLKTEGKAKQYTENLSAKLQNSNQNSTFPGLA